MNNEWIWHRLISTMGWQRPEAEYTLFVKLLSGKTVILCAKFTWTVASLQSILEIRHGTSFPGCLRLGKLGGSLLDPRRALWEMNVQRMHSLRQVWSTHQRELTCTF